MHLAFVGTGVLDGPHKHGREWTVEDAGPYRRIIYPFL